MAAVNTFLIVETVLLLAMAGTIAYRFVARARSRERSSHSYWHATSSH